MRSSILLISQFLVLTLSWQAHAEYRVFLLRIEDVQTKQVRSVQSTLDPIQYPRYHTVLASEQVTYTETWRCFGRTSDFADFCPNPKAQPKSENPVNTP